jgi:hypothetical protein
MPRLTPRTYLSQYLWLSALLEHDPSALSTLTPREQSFLHAYFRPTESIAASYLLVHRTCISKQQPTLPQAAGRTLKELERHVAAPVAVTAGSAGSRRHPVVHAVTRPKPDTDRMVKALLRIAEDFKLDPPA